MQLNIEFLLERLENSMGKCEDFNQHFSPFSKVFLSFSKREQNIVVMIMW